MAPESIESFKIDIAEADLADLRARLRNTRWPEAIDDGDWEYGIEQAYLMELAGYWAERYQWREHEAALNRFAQFRTQIDGQTIHFIHERSREPDAIPLIISHGWPGSIAEFAKIIGPLTDPAAHGGKASDAFDVVCPSLPGYGFSTPTDAKGWDTRRTARAFARLMARLGYDRYAAQGGDFGSFVSQFLARQDPEHCFAIHLNFLFAPPPSAEAVAELDEEEKKRYARFERYYGEESAYAQLQWTKPQTLGFALTDSPVGQLAWIAEKYRGWTDCAGRIENAVTRDELLTAVSIYWFTRTAPSSARMYRESRLSLAFLPEPLRDTPIGYARFPEETVDCPRKWVEADYNVVHWTDMPRGGHFAALEQPELLVEDIRDFYRQWR